VFCLGSLISLADTLSVSQQTSLVRYGKLKLETYLCIELIAVRLRKEYLYSLPLPTGIQSTRHIKNLVSCDAG
jgi:hypothetical protein